MAYGKIARLPHEVREELNERLLNGEEGQGLLDWLNGLPEVRAVLAEQFAGEAITAQNLSQYRQRGFRDWENQQEALAEARRLARDAGEVEHAVPGRGARCKRLTLAVLQEGRDAVLPYLLFGKLL